MRHRIGIVLAVIMTGVLFFPGAWGYLRLLRVPAPADQLSDLQAGGGSLISEHHVLLALAAVAGTALLAGILVAAPRISPLAAGLPGLLLLGWTGLYLASVRQGGRPDPAALRSVRRGLRGHALQRDPRRGRPSYDRPDVHPRQVANPPLTAIADDEFTALEPELEDQPTTQLTPIRVTAMAPIPAAPWHDVSPPTTPDASKALVILEVRRLRQRDRHHLQTVDPLEVRSIAGVNRKAVSHGGCRDQRVIGARGGFPAGLPQ